MELLNKPSVDILDESDELLSHKFQLVYAWGTQCSLPSVQERVLTVQHVLQILAKDAGIRAVISASTAKESQQQKRVDESIETESISLTDHPKRYGSLPSIRLIPGAVRLLKLCFSLPCVCSEACIYITAD